MTFYSRKIWQFPYPFRFLHVDQYCLLNNLISYLCLGGWSFNEKEKFEFELCKENNIKLCHCKIWKTSEISVQRSLQSLALHSATKFSFVLG